MHHDRSADKAAKLRLDEMFRIKRLLDEAGLTLTKIDVEYGLAKGTCGQHAAAGEPCRRAGDCCRPAAPPEHLWRSRYHPDGQRRSPPCRAENYERPPGKKARRQKHEASGPMQEAA